MKNILFTLAFMLIGSLSFASTNVESDLDVNSENATELSITDIENTMLLNEDFTIEIVTVDLGFFGCTSSVTVIDKDTKKVLAEFEYYDEECEGDSQVEFWYV